MAFGLCALRSAGRVIWLQATMLAFLCHVLCMESKMPLQSVWNSWRVLCLPSCVAVVAVQEAQHPGTTHFLTGDYIACLLIYTGFC
jgi:hypothetical protein